MGNRLNRINIDLGQYKQPWVEYCRTRNETPSSLFRQLAAREMADAAVVPAVAAAGGKVRKQIQLTPEELVFVIQEARRAGLSETRWITALIRSKMSSEPQLGQSEMEILGRSNLALLAIGRNLNQLARVANGSAAVEAAILVPLLAALRVQLSSHVDSVAQLLSANVRRWSPS